MSLKNYNPSYFIYIAGLFPLAFLIQKFKNEFGDTWWIVAVVIVYLLILRVAGDYVAKKSPKK